MGIRDILVLSVEQFVVQPEALAALRLRDLVVRFDDPVAKIRLLFIPLTPAGIASPLALAGVASYALCWI